MEIEESGWGGELELFSELMAEATDFEEAIAISTKDMSVDRPFAPINSRFAVECGVTLFFEVIIIGMLDSFGPENHGASKDARIWCVEEMPDLWERLTNKRPTRVVEWLQSMWTYTYGNETKRKRIRKMLREARNKQGSNQYMRGNDE